MNVVELILEFLKRPGTIPLVIGLILAWASQQSDDNPVIKPYADYLFIAGIVISVGGLIWLGLRRRPPSRLAKPEALKQVSKAFVGREDDQTKLSQLVRNHALVFLVGESGSGKSTLLHRGVLPELEGDSTVLPAYLNYWGPDWENDVRDSLTRALRDSSGDAQLTPGDLGPWLAAQRTKGRLPILLFDQFDDYITRHRKHFLPDEPGGRVLNVKELLERNRLWNELAPLVQDGSIHCLFTVRRDMHWGLTCARFRPEEVYLLSRLGRGVASGLLNQLTGGDVIGEPEGGWQALKDRLCGDLERDGLLPIRMRLVFQSLSALDRLTLRTYEGVGGLVGLEATHIGDQVENAARLSGLSPLALRKMLVEMVDRESQKTVVRTEEQLLTTFDDSTGDRGFTGPQAGGDGTPSKTLPANEPSHSSPLRTALEVLAGQEVTRQRLEAHSPEAVWQLDHDYLANGVIELDKRENRWRYVLEDKARRFREAGTWAARFKSLLSPWQQIRIASQAVRRRLRFAPHQRFAAYSAARLVVNPWLPLIVALVMAGNWWWTQEQARNLFSSIRDRGPIQAAEAQALWDMTQVSPAVRRAVVHTALALGGDAVRFGALTSSPLDLSFYDSSDRRSSHVLHATVGMDQQQRQAILREQITGACSARDLQGFDQRRACALTAMELDGEPLITIDLILAVMEKTTDSFQISSLVEGLAGLGQRLAEPQVAEASWLLVAAMEKTTAPIQGSILAHSLAGLGQRLEAPQAVEVARRLLVVMEKTTNAPHLSTLAQGLAGLGQRLEAPQAAEVARRLVATMEKTTDPDQLSALAQGLAGVGQRLEAPQVAEVSRRLLVAMEKTTNAPHLSALAQGLAGLGQRLAAPQAVEGERILVAAMAKTTDPSELSSLAQGLAGLGELLAAPQAAEVARILVAAMEKTTDPSQLSSLAQRLAGLGERLAVPQAAEGARLLVAAMEKTTDPFQLIFMARGLADLGARLVAPQTAQGAGLLVAAMVKATNPLSGSILARSLAALGERLAAPQATEFARLLVATMEKTTSPLQLASLAQGLAGLGELLAAPQAAEGARRLVAAMVKTSDPDELVVLAQGLVGLGERLATPQAVEFARLILAAMEKTTDSDQLSYLAQGLAGLGERLAAPQAAEGARLILAAMEKTTDSDQLSYLAQGLAGLGERLAAPQATEFARLLLAAMEKTTDRFDLRPLVQGLASLGSRLSASEATAVLATAQARVHGMIAPPCDAFAPLVRRENLTYVVEELLKWPTCSTADRERLIVGIAKATGQGDQFGCPDPSNDKQCTPNWWAFVAWAEENGYDTLRPPAPPAEILN